MTIHGNVDYLANHPAATTTNSANFIGDFDVAVKLNESGKLNLKVFNRANNIMLYDIAPYTQGIGLNYKEEFNNLHELLLLYKEKLRRKAPDTIRVPVPVNK